MERIIQHGKNQRRANQNADKTHNDILHLKPPERRENHGKILHLRLSLVKERHRPPSSHEYICNE
jgi:hypothetical protein